MNTPTNVSPIETLYATSGAEKRRNVIKEDGIDRRELFSSLVNGASLSQIAYAGLSQEFNLTLSLQDNNFNSDLRAVDQDTTHNETFAPTPDKRDTATKLEDAPATLDYEQPVEESVTENAAPQIENNYFSEPDVDQGTVSAIKETKSINPTERTNDSTSITTQTPEMQFAATITSRPEAVIQGPREVASANNAATVNKTQNRDPVSLQVSKLEEVNSNAVLRNAGNAKGNSLRAKVTEAPEELVSQPSANLAASSAVSAQANLQNRVGGDPVRLPAGDLANDGDIALNGAVTRQGSKQGTANQQNNSSLNQQGTQAKNDSQGTASGAQQSAEQALAAATQRNNLFAATLARSGVTQNQPSIQPVSGDLGIGNATNGQQQPTRATDLPQPQRARPQLPPRFVSEQISVQVQRALGQGTDRINIQLKPAELGKIEVKLEVAHDGKINAVIAAERSDTLDLLRQDARHLQQSLQSAGLNADSSSLSFTLKNQDNSFQQALAKDDRDDAEEAEALVNDAESGSAPKDRQIVSDDKIDVQV